MDRTQAARRLALEAGWRERNIDSEGFVIKSWSVKPVSFIGAGKRLRIYIEGDGFAWVNRNRPSMDPTPREPLALKLALLDPAPAVAYLGRPCQYVLSERPGICSEEHWTGERFSDTVIEAMSGAISSLKEEFGADDIELVGFSGGGAVAVLVAARRQDVRSIRTVAGNLDPGEVSRIHRVSPLKGSLDPIEAAMKLRGIPQTHYVGGGDRTVPPGIAHRFFLAAGAPDHVRVRLVEEAGHDSGWEERWPDLLAEAADR